MHVMALYHISDSAGFRAIAEEPFPGRPAHWRLVSSAPTRDGSTCFALWWADSADALQLVLHRAVGNTARVDCYEIDDDGALGIERTPLTIIRMTQPEQAGRTAHLHLKDQLP